MDKELIKLFDEFGIQICNDNGGYRSMFDVLEELSKVWGNMIMDEKGKNKSVSEDGFKSLIGRKFKVWFRSLGDVKHNPLTQYVKAHYIEGVLENFSPTGYIVLNGDDYGFNIIPYMCLIQMLEMKEE